MAKAQDAKDRITAEIREGVYLPGSRLPTRHELMARYGLARATVDKVIGALCDDGLLVSTRGSGTYVASAGDAGRLSAFIVLNSETECMSSGLMEREWNFIINRDEVRSRCVLIGCHEVDRFLPAIRANPHARVIWNRPALKSYATIVELDDANRLQILVNRTIPRFNYVASDVRPALEQAFARIRSERPDAVLAVLPPFLNPEEHYLAEREILFYELAATFGFRVVPLTRTDTVDHGGTVRIVREALTRKPDVLYVPDYYMTPYVMALIGERGLRFGHDITLITSDWNEAPASTPGLICLRQPWRTMFQTALDWSLQERPGKMQRRIASEMQVNSA
jgi:DNA-binding transcriptional regulator YhcF (GntR family)